MINLINKILFYTKVVLFLVAFSFVLYITLIKMDYSSSNLLVVLPMFVPFFLLLILIVFGFFLNVGNNNFLYNLSSCLAFLSMIIISIRTIFDQNIIPYPFKMNINFFTFQEVRIKILLYLILIGDICLIYQDKKVKIHS